VKVFYADMHIHTCLSPCSELEMSPKAIVRQAAAMGLDMIAICDHNSSENVQAAKHAARDLDLTVIGGIEITSREEVHMLGFFRDGISLAEVQNVIYNNLSGENDPDYFGDQLVVDDEDTIIAENNHLLIGATELTLKEIVRLVHKWNGIVIASHIDRPSFSLISQLGFIPKDLDLDGLEVFSGVIPSVTESRTVIFSSDAHRLDEIGRRSTGFYMKNKSFEEIKMALDNSGGRKIMAL